MRILAARRGPSAPAQSVGSVATSGGASTADSAAFRILRTNENAVDVGDAEFTVETWIRPSDTDADNGSTAVTEGANYSGTDGNIIWDADGFNTDRGFIFGLDSGALYLSVNNAGGVRTIIGTTDLRDGQWHHIAVYFNASSGLMDIFVGGNREDTFSGPSGTVAHNSAATDTDGYHIIGKEKLNLTLGFDGDVSETRISTNQRYSGATYTVPTGPFTTDGNTVWLSHFDDGSGTTVSDVSGNNIDGELIGNPVPPWSTQDPF